MAAISLLLLTFTPAAADDGDEPTELALTGSASISQAALGHRAGIQDLLLYVADLSRDPQDDSQSVIFVPVPTRAHVQAIGDEVWEDVAHITAPGLAALSVSEQPAAWFHPTHGTDTPAQRNGVGNSLEFTAGYSAVFGHDQPDELSAWLRSGNFVPSSAQSRVINTYLDAGWWIAILSVPPGGAITWQLSYRTPEPTFPLRALSPVVQTSNGKLPLAVLASSRMERNDAGATTNPASSVMSVALDANAHKLRPGGLGSQFLHDAVEHGQILTAMTLPALSVLEQETLTDLSFAPVQHPAQGPMAGASGGSGSGAALVVGAVFFAAGAVGWAVAKRRRRPGHPTQVAAVN